MSKYPLIEGEPPTFRSPNEQAWQSAIRRVCPDSLKNPCLKFTVKSWLRNSNYFDLDNISKPVLDVVGKEATSIWVAVDIGEPAGVVINDEIPPLLPELCEGPIHIANPPVQSRRQSDPLSELEGRKIIGSTEPLGLIIAVDSDEVQIANFDFNGPIKPLIDKLGPLLGTDHQGVADHRIHEIRISKGHLFGGKGVSIGLWFL